MHLIGLTVLLFLPLRLGAQPSLLRTALQEEGACAAKALWPHMPAVTQGTYADEHIDVGYYRIDLNVHPFLSMLHGAVLIRGTSLVDSLRQISLDLDAAMRVDSVRSGHTGLSFSRFPLGLVVTLDRMYARGDPFALEVFYAGTPTVNGFGSFVFTAVTGVPWVWSLSEPYGARNWWPCKDTPNDKADSADILITCPIELKVGSNGRLVGVRENGDGTHTYQWAERYPIATYLVSVAISNYSEFTQWFRYSPTDSMPILNYVLPRDLNQAVPALALTPEMLRVFSATYGLYPFIREKYGHSQFGWGGAMEHQTMTSTSNFTEGTIAHELAHQWFGDMITCANWPSLWLNEGFAVYSEAVWQEARYGKAAYRIHLSDRMSAAMGASGTLFVQDTNDVRNLFNFNRVYAKGGWVLHMLRHVLGDSVFFQSMRAYAADPRFRFGSATTEGFESVCEAVAGRSLAYFFNEWVFGEGFPRYTTTWHSASVGGAYEVTVRIDQTTGGTNPAFFTMPVDLMFSGGTQDTTVVAFNTVPGETFTYHLPFRPTDVVLDPENWILREIVAPESLLPDAYALEQNFPNPFNPGTSINFSLPRRSDISLTVYDLLGREVALLARGRYEAGKHTIRWEGTGTTGVPVASGVYLCRLTAESFSTARTMLLLR